MKNRYLLLVFSVVAMNCLQADEFKMPLVPASEALPSYTEPKKNPWGLKILAQTYDRSQDKAFMSLGLKAKPLSSLIFNQDSFKISDAFAPGATSQMTKKMNVSLNSSTLFPRVSFSERGVNVGIHCEYPGPLKKSRVGIRVNMPFKTMRMERDDQAAANAAGNQRDYILGVIAGISGVPTLAGTGATIPLSSIVGVETNMYKASLLINLPTVQGGNVVSVFNAATSDGTSVAINGQAYKDVDPGNGFGGILIDIRKPYAVFLWKDTKNIPTIENRAIQLRNGINAQLPGSAGISQVFISNTTTDLSSSNGISGTIMDTGNTVPAANVHNYSTGLGTATVDLQVGPLQALPTNYSTIQEDTLYTFEQGKFADYQTLLQEHGDTLWFMTTNRADNGSRVDPATDDFIQRRINQYGSQSADQWLWSNGYQFDTTQRTGVGDLSADIFYEYTFNPRWQGELVLGVIMPTESASNPGGHAYKPVLGNNGHYGLKVGGSVTWLPLDYMRVQADGSYTFTLESTEHRFAAFKGATIKNIGPVVDADVEFGTFNGSLNATLCHPKAKAFSLTLGYDFKYKEEDDVQFKQKTYDFGANGGTWFGGLYNPTTKLYGSNVQTLDNAVARMNTESISHKVRVQSALKFYGYVEISAGGAYTVMGQNAPQERELFCGLTTWF